jgi:GAF domain-containing protein
VSPLEIAGVVALGWMALSALASVLLMRRLRRESKIDALAEQAAEELVELIESWSIEPEPSAGGARPRLRVVRGELTALPSLRQSGYLGLVLERLAIHARSIFGADETCVFVRDPRAPGDALVPAVGAGIDPDLIGRPFPIDWGPVGAAIACGRPTVVLDQLWPGWRAEHAGAGAVRRAAVAPVSLGGSVQGILSVAHRSGGPGFDMSELALLGELAQFVGHALAHHRRRELSASDPQAEIEGLVRTLARIEPETGSHGADVAKVTGWAAAELALPPADQLELELGARLHDVGQLRLPPHILRKRGSLTEVEWELMRLHPVWGAEMAAPVPGLEAVALVVRFHHERWDGAGYPDGLSGERIPLASRLIAIGDAFSAMTSERPYRRTLDRRSALQELEALGGSQFDPELTALFVRVASRAGVHPTA